jgi:hypothetical protein
LNEVENETRRKEGEEEKKRKSKKIPERKEK